MRKPLLERQNKAAVEEKLIREYQRAEEIPVVYLSTKTANTVARAFATDMMCLLAGLACSTLF